MPQQSPFLFFWFLLVTLLVLVAATGSHAALPAEAYWQKVLPSTPMPSILRDAFNAAAADSVGEVKAIPLPSFRSYRYGAHNEDLEDTKLAIFFLAKDLHPGSKMNLIFSKAAFSRSININYGPPGAKVDNHPAPLSLDEKKLPEILKQLSIRPESAEAKELRETIDACTRPAIKGEDRYCPTSLESMIDFAVSKLGTKHVEILTTGVDKAVRSVPQEYTIREGVKMVKGPKSVACHPQTYIYPVYYCHETADTSVYQVPLMGKDGSEVKAVVVCHKDTSAWNPKHMAFQVLKVKPGTVPICHFLPQSHIVWTQN